jgi:hypothetical protein
MDATFSQKGEAVLKKKEEGRGYQREMLDDEVRELFACLSIRPL